MNPKTQYQINSNGVPFITVILLPVCLKMLWKWIMLSLFNKGSHLEALTLMGHVTIPPYWDCRSILRQKRQSLFTDVLIGLPNKPRSYVAPLLPLRHAVQKNRQRERDFLLLHFSCKSSDCGATSSISRRPTHVLMPLFQARHVWVRKAHSVGLVSRSFDIHNEPPSHAAHLLLTTKVKKVHGTFCVGDF